MFILMNLRQVELEGKFFLFSYVVAHKNNNIIFKAQNHQNKSTSIFWWKYNIYIG